MSPASRLGRSTLYIGTFIHTPSLGELEVLEDSIVRVDPKGIIIGVYRNVLCNSKEREVDSRGWKNSIDRLIEQGKVGPDDEEGFALQYGRMDGSGWWACGFVGEFCSP